MDLTIGTICKVYILGDHEKISVTEGKFTGFINLGEESAMVIETKEVEGNYRIIPVNSISAIDIIELAKPNEKKEDIPSYYK